MLKLTESTKIAENEVCNFYVDSFTEGADQWAKKWGLGGIKCLVAEQKSDPNDKEYVLIQDNEFVYSSKSYESIAVHIDTIALSQGKTIKSEVI
jgi:hypothetical protein